MAEFDVTYKLVDDFQRETSKRYVFSVADYATALTEAGNFASDLAGLTEARILQYTINTVVPYIDAVTADANIDEGLTVSVRKQDNQKAVIKVPAPLSAVFLPDGTLDVTDAAFTAFISNFLSGVVTVSDGEIAAEVLGGKLDK